MREIRTAVSMAALLLLIAVAARKPTTQATSPMQAEGLNPVALTDDTAAIPAKKPAEPVQPAQEQDVDPAPALLEETTTASTAGADLAAEGQADASSLSAVSTTAACPTCAPAIRYAQPTYQPSTNFHRSSSSGRRFQPIRRLLGRRR